MKIKWRFTIWVLGFLAGFALPFALAAQDSVTVIVSWNVIFASNQDAVLVYDLEARSSTDINAVQDFGNSDGGDRQIVADTTIRETSSQRFSHSFNVRRPDCCAPLHVGVRLRGVHLGLDGPWTNPAYPTVALSGAPLTIPQVFPQVDTLGVPDFPSDNEVALVNIRWPSIELEVGMPPTQVVDYVYVEMGDLTDPDPNGQPWPDGMGAPYPHLHAAALNEPVDCREQVWTTEDGRSSGTHDCNWVYWMGNKCEGDYGCILDYCGGEDFQCEVQLGA